MALTADTPDLSTLPPFVWEEILAG
jgi:hypothetical protein